MNSYGLPGNKKLLAILLLLSIAYGSLFFYLRTQQYKSFFSYEWEDDARENQTVYNIGQHNLWHQTIYQDKYPHFLNDHFTPVYFLIALFYKFFPHIYTWYFLMSFGYALSSLIVYATARRMLGDAKLAFLVSLIYLAYPPLHYITLGALDARNFTLPFLFLSFYFLYTRKFIPYTACIFISSLCMEDIPLVIAGLGFYSLVRKYPRKWWMTTLLFSFIYFMCAVYIANNFCRIKGINSANQLNYIDIDNLRHYMAFLLGDRGILLRSILLNKLMPIAMVLSPLLFMPLVSIEMYIPLVVFLELLLANTNGFPNANSYYLASIIPFVFISLIFVLKRIVGRFGTKKAYVLSGFILLVSMLGIFSRNIIGLTADESPVMRERYSYLYDKQFLGVRNIFDGRFYAVDREDRVAWEFINLIPKNASVIATGDLLPALSSRKKVFEFGFNHPAAQESFYDFTLYLSPLSYDVDYALINKKCLINGLGGHYSYFPKAEDLEKEIRRLIRDFNFRVIKEKDNFVLLQSGSSSPRR